MNSDFDFKSPGDIRAQNAPKKAGSPLAPLRRRLFFLRAGSFTVSAAPLTVLLILRFPRYAATPGQTVRLGAGCLVLCLFLLLKVLGKLKVPGRVTVFATVFLLSYLLSALLTDLTLLSGAALLGEALDLCLFSAPLAETGAELSAARQALATVKICRDFEGRT